MKKLHFSATIHAPADVVWNTLFEDRTYRIWTTPFCEGSYFEGSWDRGERIRFLGPGGSGLTAVIAENIPFEHLSIKHLGVINAGVEDLESEQVRSWAPAFENYSLAGVGDSTELRVDLEIPPEFETTMLESWPRALVVLKGLCETGPNHPTNA